MDIRQSIAQTDNFPDKNAYEEHKTYFRTLKYPFHPLFPSFYQGNGP